MIKQFDLEGSPVKFPVFFLRWSLIPNPVLKKCGNCNTMIEASYRIYYCIDCKIKLYKKDQSSLDDF